MWIRARKPIQLLRQEELARRANMAKAQQAAAEERIAKFAATHERLRNEPGPRGAGPRTAHPGGIVTTNKAHATVKFLERKGKGAGVVSQGAKERKRVRWEDEEEEEQRARMLRLPSKPQCRRAY